MAGTGLSVERVYAETCSSIRATDDISFKLMGILPVLSGATFLTLFIKGPIPLGNGWLVVALSLFAALITLGLFRWELRNIQRCTWLSKRAEAMEEAMDNDVRPRLSKLPDAPNGIGKTEAEKWVYSVTILAWLSIPAVVSAGSLKDWLLWVYIAAALIVLFLTAASALKDVQNLIQSVSKAAKA
jgi:hypothetical protein